MGRSRPETLTEAGLSGLRGSGAKATGVLWVS